MTRLRIVLIQKRPHPNSLGVVKALKNRGHDVTMIVHSADSLVDDWGVEIRVVPYIARDVFRRLKNPNSWAIPKPITLWLELYRIAPHVVVLKKLRMPNRIAALMAKMLGARLVALTNERIALERRSKAVRPLARALDPRRQIYTAGDGLIGSTARSHRSLRVLLPYPVDAVKPSALPSQSHDVGGTNKIRILMIASMGSTRKRHEWLTLAVAEAGLEREVEITYVGTGGYDSAQAQAVRMLERELGLPQSLMRFNVPHEELIESYSGYDLLAMPAKNEPFGAVVAEALAHGVPVICSSSCGARSCLIDGVNGMVFRSESFRDFQAKLSYLVRNNSVRADMGQQARVLAEQYLSVGGWGQEFDRLLVSKVPVVAGMKWSGAKKGAE